MTTLNLGLSVNDVVNVSVFLQPLAAQQRNFGSLLILGDSQVIDTQTRYRQYSSISGVAGDYPTTAPEYLAAEDFFEQAPQPSILYIGAWARTATSGSLFGGALSAAQQALSNFTAITNGNINITVNGVNNTWTGINFSAATSLTQVAAILQAAIGGGSLTNVTWNPNTSNFIIDSNTTGASSSVVFLSTTLNNMGFAGTAGGYSVTGIPAETALAAATILTQLSNSWYGLMFAASVMPTDANLVSTATLIQAANPVRIFGTTTQEATALQTGDSTSLPYLLSQGNYTRTFCQYSSSDPNVCAAIFGIAFTCNFEGSNTLYTLKFQQETGIVAETLTESQAAQLNQTNCNVFVNYNNNTAILQQGTMASGQFFDVIHGTDWLQNAAQTAVYNVLLTAGTKVPQTDPGVTRLVNALTGVMQQGVANGLIAPGVWLGPPVGEIVTGQTLSTGYYVFAPPVSTQSQAARAARQAPVITVALKLAGAIHFANVVMNVSN